MNKPLVLEMEYLSPSGPVGEACMWLIYRKLWENGEILFLSGDRVYWGLLVVYNRRLWKLATLSIWAPLGNLEGVCLPGL